MSNTSDATLSLGSKGHEDLMRQFEMVYKSVPVRVRFDREAKDMWSKGHLYQDGLTNDLFIAFRHGCAYGLVVAS